MTESNILFIQPLFYDPCLPNFKDKFELLSDRCEGHVISSSDRKFHNLKLGSFSYHGLPFIRNRLKRYLYYFLKIIFIGLKVNRIKKIDYILSYDPLVYGIAGVFLRILTGAKLIIEINGDIQVAGFLKKRGAMITFKRWTITTLSGIVLRNADIVKFLNPKQIKDWDKFLTRRTQVDVFQDFVPTHIFDPQKSRDERYLFFIGHPFYLKGVDILIKAFLEISSEFPSIHLRIVGHCHGGKKERDQYVAMAGGNPRIEILKPVFYDQAVELFHKCTFFILPSRVEAMGRVLIEAMSCGKAVIGSDVGGISRLIEDGCNGFLFESENVDELANKMRKLLADSGLRQTMGSRGVEMVKERFSSQRYVDHFMKMIHREDGLAK